MNTTINFEKPLFGVDPNKPTSLSNQKFPYNQIANPRRFEELLYSIFDLKIRNGEITAFDDIDIMSGVRDQGRDCTLMRNGKCYGLIQCKKYERNYKKNDFGLEIIRFALYSLVDSRLIADRNDFTYYIAVSTGFANDCGNFIDDFSNNIKTEPKFEEWVNRNLELPSLSKLKFTLDLEDFKNLVAGFHVKKIVPQDLDKDLISSSCSSLIPLFFEVRMVVDNSKIEKLITHLQNALTPEELLRQLKIGSARLKSERNTFLDIENSHVERAETIQLYHWILEAPERKDGISRNICLLAGQAGCGKTVVLKDLYTKCLDNDIVVLGLKADKLYSNTIIGLQESLGFTLPVHDMIKECKKHFSRIVILIDQIDALSQSMSSDRSYLELYRSFIDYYSNDDNIRFIISVRISDLLYDPSLKVYKDTKTIQLGLLTQNQVLELLGKINIKAVDLSPRLLELLRVPNHLNIFSQIVSNRSILQAGNVLELFHELWQQKVARIYASIPAKKAGVKELLYAIAKQMFQDQRISVSTLCYEDYTEEIHYLESERLIKVEDRSIQFFHQSFYDFVFAKQFVESSGNLLDYIKNGEQSIHIRSAVKMIISYLREWSPYQYIEVLNNVFFNDEILFHIKHILVVTIASQESPTHEEREFVLRSFSFSFHWKSVFFEHAISKPWLDFAMENNLLQILDEECVVWSADSENIQTFHLDKAKNVIGAFLNRFVVGQNDDDAWQALTIIKNEPFVRNTLSLITDWSNPISYRIFEEISHFEEKYGQAYYHILGNIAKINPTYVLTKLDKILPLHFEKSLSERDYKEIKALKVLAKKVPQLLFPILFKVIKSDLDGNLVSLNTQETEILIKDFFYSNVDLLDAENVQYGSGFLYQLLAECLKKCAREHKSEFLAFFDAHKNSCYEAILRLLLFALKENECLFVNQVFELFEIFKTQDMLTFGSDISHDLRELLGKSFPKFNDDQKQFVIQTIKTYKNKREITYCKSIGEEKGFVSSNWGMTKLLMMKRLPLEVIETEFKREFRELVEKFKHKDITDHKKTRRLLAGIVRSPITDIACARMGVRHWLKAFKTYDKNINRSGKDYLKGSLHQLATSFQSAVRLYPGTDKLIIISEVIKDDSLPVKYAIYGLLGWLEGKGDKSLIVPLVKEMLHRDRKEDTRISISIVAEIIGNEIEEPEFVDFLVDEALDYGIGNENVFQIEENTETSVNGLVTKAINTDYGIAIKALARIVDHRYENAVFETMEKILKNGPRESRAVAFFEFSYLLNLNKKRTFDTFSKWIAKENDLYVVASSIVSLQYLIHNGSFLKFRPSYEKLILSRLLGYDDTYMLFMVLYAAYLYNEDSVDQLLYLTLDLNSNIWVSALNEVFKNYYLIDDSKSKNDKLLSFLLDKITEDQVEDLNCRLAHIDHLKLDDIYPFLKQYVQAKFFRLSSHFLEYLITQIANSPFKAIELFELALKNKHKTVYRFALENEEPFIRFIVNAYNGLNQNTNKAKIERRRLLSMFDTLLQDYLYGSNSDKILEDLI